MCEYCTQSKLPCLNFLNRKWIFQFKQEILPKVSWLNFFQCIFLHVKGSVYNPFCSVTLPFALFNPSEIKAIFPFPTRNETGLHWFFKKVSFFILKAECSKYFKFHVCFCFLRIAMMNLETVSDTAENWFLCKLKFHPKESLCILFLLFLQEISLLISPISW